MITTELRDKTIEMLRNRPATLTYEQIEQQTTIPAGWLKALARGVIEDPGVNRVQTLNSYLQSVFAKLPR